MSRHIQVPYAVFQLILKPQSSLPSHFPRSPSDRFLIKTILAPALTLLIRLTLILQTRCSLSKGDVNTVKKIVKWQRTLLPELPAEEAESLFQFAGNSDGMASFLVKAGLKTEDGEALGRMKEMARLVAQCGPVDCRNKEGSTPLYRAAMSGDRRMVEVLMELGADPTIGSFDGGRSPIDVARDKGFKEVTDILEQGETVMTAARHGDSTHLEWLLSRGTSSTWCDQYGMTALHVAAIKGHKDIVTLLLEFKSELDSRDNEGHTPLHMAVEGGWHETVEVLLNRGANLNAKSNKAATPLYIAKVMGFDDIYKFLTRRGASDRSTSSSSLSSIL